MFTLFQARLRCASDFSVLEKDREKNRYKRTREKEMKKVTWQ